MNILTVRSCCYYLIVTQVSTVEIHLDSVDDLSAKKQGFGKTEVRLHSNMAKVRSSNL